MQTINSNFTIQDDLDEQELILKSPKGCCTNAQIKNAKKSKHCCSKEKLALILILSILIMLIILVLLSLLLRFVIIPQKINEIIENSKLEVIHVNLYNPGNNTVDIKCVGYLNQASFLNTYLSSSSLFMKFKDSEIGSMAISQIPLIPNSQNNTTPLNFDSTLEIINQTIFSLFSREMINQAFVTWQLQGNVIVEIPIFFNTKIEVSLKKDILIRGLDGLTNVKLYDVNFNKSTSKQVIINGLIDIINPSSVEITPIGDLNLDIYYKNSFFGHATVSNCSIFRGNNIFPILANISTNNMTLASDLISDFISSKIIQISATSTLNGTISSIPLYNQALEGLKFNTSFIQTPPIDLIKSFEILSLSLVPLSNTTCKINVSLNANIYNPLGENSPFTIQHINLSLDLLYKGYSTGHFEAQVKKLSQTKNWVQLNVSTIFYINQTKIGSSKLAFVQFLYDFEHLKQVSLTFKGHSQIQANIEALGLVEIKNVNLELENILQALNNLKDTKMLEIDVPGNASGPIGSGLSLIANGSIYNPSVVTIFLGRVLMEMYLNDTYMGCFEFEQFNLFPGTNIIKIEGVLLPQNLQKTSYFFVDYLTGVDSFVSVSAISQENIEWLNDAVSSLAIQVLVPGRINFEIVSQMNVLDLFMNFNNKYPIANGTIQAFYNPPFSFRFRLIETSMKIIMSFENLSIAHMQLPLTHIEHDFEHRSFQVSTQNLAVLPTNETQFSNLMGHLFSLKQITAGLSGFCMVTLESNMGVMDLKNIPFSNQIFLNGTFQFKDPPVSIKDLNLIGGIPGFAFITLQLNISNPASAGLAIGNLLTNLVFKNTIIGNGTIENMILKKGLNTYKVQAVFIQNEKNYLVGREFLSLFVQGLPLNVSLKGNQWSTNISILRNALSLLDAPAIIPGFTEKLIQFAQLRLSLEIFKSQIPVQLTIFNPFDANISIIFVNISIFFNQTLVATVNLNLTDNPIVAFSKQRTLTRELFGKIKDIPLGLLDSLLGKVYVDIKGTLTVNIGGFETELDYIQIKIPASFQPEQIK